MMDPALSCKCFVSKVPGAGKTFMISDLMITQIRIERMIPPK